MFFAQYEDDNDHRESQHKQTPTLLILLFSMQIICFLPDYRKKQTEGKNYSCDDLSFLSLHCLEIPGRGPE